jgi:hypothetical protein
MLERLVWSPGRAHLESQISRAGLEILARGDGCHRFVTLGSFAGWI